MAGTAEPHYLQLVSLQVHLLPEIYSSLPDQYLGYLCSHLWTRVEQENKFELPSVPVLAEMEQGNALLSVQLLL